MVDLTEENYKKALKKATYYVGEIEEKTKLWSDRGFTLGLRENM